MAIRHKLATTQTAADLLNVLSSHLIKSLEENAITSERSGAQPDHVDFDCAQQKMIARKAR